MNRTRMLNYQSTGMHQGFEAAKIAKSNETPHTFYMTPTNSTASHFDQKGSAVSPDFTGFIPSQCTHIPSRCRCR